MDKNYLIASIGRKVSTEDIGDEELTFIYKSEQYIQLIIWNRFSTILGKQNLNLVFCTFC